jgi:recombination protein U
MKHKYANRGMGLETLIEYANEQYASKGIAQIQKVATPWKVIRKGREIVSAFPERKSTVDFIGVYQGKAIAFDAKQTELKTRFPYSNVEDHQINFMKSWEARGGYAFFVIEFKAFDETYFLPFNKFMDASIWNGESIPYKWFKNFGIRIKQGNGILLDYLREIS